MFGGFRGIATLFLYVVILCIFLTPSGVAGVGSQDLVHDGADSPHFTAEWVAEITGGERHARSVAQENGFRFHKRLLGHDNHYLLVRDDHPVRSKRSAEHHTHSLLSDGRVEWAEQQIEKIRIKRGMYSDALSRREEELFPTKDELSSEQWYLTQQQKDGSKSENDISSRATGSKTISLDVVAAWAKGYFGEGIAVSVIDDGLEWKHPDIINNYCKNASYDINDDDDDPTPRYDPTNENKHGTRCAGEIAMEANNGICGVGVAYKAKIGGIRMLDGKVTDSSEAMAFRVGVDPHYVDIFSASWGPNDDGKTIEGPGKLANEALIHGVTHGRGGRGVIFVWASGNGGGAGDNCDCDGYTGSIYTLSISSASMSCKSPWYSEKCASTMATTYSSGQGTDKSVVSVDLHFGCTQFFTGTSAAAPMGAGVLALVLGANQNMTWRDVQWLTMLTANYEALSANEGWSKNGACIMVNSHFGAGLLDGNAMIELATDPKFESVPEKSICTTDVKDVNPTALPKKFCGGDEVTVIIDTCGCKDQENEINYLEHVQVYVNISADRRGDLAVYMQSPQGEKRTMLLSNREKDNHTEGLKNWPLMSVHQWGEDPCGEWKVIVENNGEKDSCSEVNGVELVLHGTKEKPWMLEKVGCRQYDQNAIDDAYEFSSRKEQEQQNELKDEMQLFDSYITSEDGEKSKQRQLETNPASNILGSGPTKLEDEIGYNLDKNFINEDLSKSADLFSDTDPDLLIRKNRIDRRFEVKGRSQNDVIMEHQQFPKQHGGGNYGDQNTLNRQPKLNFRQNDGQYGNEYFRNKLQKSDFVDTNGYEAYYKNPAAALNPSANDADSYGNGDMDLNMVKGTYNTDTYQGWKDTGDIEEYYDLDYLLRKLMG